MTSGYVIGEGVFYGISDLFVGIVLWSCGVYDSMGWAGSSDILFLTRVDSGYILNKIISKESQYNNTMV